MSATTKTRHCCAPFNTVQEQEQEQDTDWNYHGCAPLYFRLQGTKKGTKS